jgi:hypothetical protein
VSVTLGKGLKEIGGDAFEGCDGLTYINIPSNVEKIAGCSFQYFTNLASVSIPDGATVGDWAFNGCTKLASVTLPDGVQGVGQDVFTNTKIYDNWVSSGNRLFYIGNWLIRVKDKAGYESCTFNSLVGVAGGAFSGCSKYLRKIVFKTSLRYIGVYAFSGCSVLSDVTIPASVEDIHKDAFGYNVSSDVTLKVYQNTYAYNYAVSNGWRHTIIGTDSISVSTLPTKTTYLEGKISLMLRGASSLFIIMIIRIIQLI